jgi:murein DD-endopeptidase
MERLAATWDLPVCRGEKSNVFGRTALIGMTNSAPSRRSYRDREVTVGLPRRIGVILGMSILLALVGGCGAGKSHQAKELPGTDTAALIRTARGQLGVPYCPGGSSPLTGFDCSGFTVWVFFQHGISLPRQSYDQYQLGQQVKAGKLRRGDLVFFEIEKKGASHVGIYVDRGRFIHCSSTGGGVREEDLNQKYWQEHFLGARRLLP